MKPVISKEEMITDYFWIWPLFCFQAGMINSGGFLSCHRFVSHVTGFGTRVGTEFLQSRYLFGFEMLLIPLGFILGCAIAGYFREVRNNRYDIPLKFISLLLFLIASAGLAGMFGNFGEPLSLQRDFILLFFLCISCGLQNGVLTSLTAGTIRTTHLTGVATDVGLGLVRFWTDPKKGEVIWLKQRILKITFFAVGATLGTLIFNQLGFYGFFIPVFTNLGLLVLLNKASSPSYQKGLVEV